MLATENIYHILNRGTDDRVIFQDRRDYGRFLLTLLECNSRNLLSKNRHRRNKCLDGAQLDHNLGESLIDILCFSLMPNHFHLAVRQLVDNGIAKFMQRVGNSYTKYFNIKHNRKGSLFMSRYKAVSVTTDIQLRHLVTYIHANPLDLVMPEWRNGELTDFKKAGEFLKNYVWSSYVLYAEGKDSDLISEIINNREILGEIYPKREEYFDAICSWSNRYLETVQH